MEWLPVQFRQKSFFIFNVQVVEPRIETNHAEEIFWKEFIRHHQDVKDAERALDCYFIEFYKVFEKAIVLTTKLLMIAL